MPKENKFKEILRESEVTSLSNYIMSQPAWVRQYFLYVLHQSAKYYSMPQSKKSILIQGFKPQPTSNFYALRDKNFESPLMKLNVHEIVFLECIDKDRNFIEICSDKQWSLAKCCNIYLSLIAKQVLDSPKDKTKLILIDYILQRINLEEYLVRAKRITIKQLDSALYAQKRTLEETGESSSLEEILIKLNYLTIEEIDDLHQLQTTAHKPCLMEDKSFELELQVQQLKEHIARLKIETISLKEENNNCKELLLQKSANIVELTKAINKQKDSVSLKGIISSVFSTQT